MYHSLSPTEGHRVCSQGLAIMNKAAINKHVQILCGHKSLIQLGEYGRAQLNRLVRLYLVRTCQHSSKVAVSFCVSPSSV